MKRAAALALLALAAFASPPAQASSPHAQAALSKVKKLSQGKGVKTGFELSPALHELSAALPSLTGADRREAEAILARPDDTQSDPENTHKWEKTATQAMPVCTDHFCVHYVVNTADASTKSYATQMADILENQVYPCENGTAANACGGGTTPGLGWRDPPSDFGTGGDDKVDVYIQDLFTNEHVFGYVAVDPGQAQQPNVPHFSYMVLDKDYSRYGDGTPEYALSAEQVTAAHEYNHVLQNGYDYLEDVWMFESTAVWIEDKVYPANNDYLNYVNDFASNTKQPLTFFSKTNLKSYGAAVWNHWLDHRFGAGAIRVAWEQSTNTGDFAPAAYGAAIGGAGGGDFPSEFDRFSAAVAEWQAPAQGFPDRYPDVPRDGSLPVGTQTNPFALPHTTFAFFDVPVPANAPRIRLVGTLPAGTVGGVALVGRTGADPTAGEVTTQLTHMSAGGVGAVELDNPARFGRITAVLVNSDPSKSGFDSTADDYVFTKDAPGVTVQMIEPGAPIPTTGAAGLISDHGAFIGGSVDPHMNDTNWQVEYGRTIAYGKMTTAQVLPGSTIGAPSISVPIGDLDANATYHYRVIATNSAGATAGRDMTFKTARDVTKPKVSIKVKRQRINKVRKAGVVYLARCNERCKGTAQLILTRRVARKLGLPTVLGKTSVRLPVRTKSTRLRLRLRRTAKAGLSSQSRTVTATLRFRVSDASRNTVSVSRHVRLLRSTL